MLDLDSSLYRGQAPRIGGILGKITKGQGWATMGETWVSWGQDEIMERMWSNGLCHSFIQQTFTEPWWCARFGLNSGDKDESGMVPPSKKLISCPHPHQVALENMFQQSALGCVQDRLTAVGRD